MDEVVEHEFCPEDRPAAVCCPSSVSEDRETFRNGAPCEIGRRNSPRIKLTKTDATSSTTNTHRLELFTAACAAESTKLPRCCTSTTITYVSCGSRCISTRELILFVPQNPTSTVTPATCNALPPVAPTEPPFIPSATPTPTPICPQYRKARCCKQKATGLPLLDGDCKTRKSIACQRIWILSDRLLLLGSGPEFESAILEKRVLLHLFPIDIANSTRMQFPSMAANHSVTGSR